MQEKEIVHKPEHYARWQIEPITYTMRINQLNGEEEL